MAVPDIASLRAAVGAPFDVPRVENPPGQAAFSQAVELAASHAKPDLWEAVLAQRWQVAPPVPGEPFPGLSELRAYVGELDQWSQAEGDPMRAFSLAKLAADIGGHLRDADAYFIQMLVACSCVTRANRMVRAVAMRSDAGPMAKEVLAGWPAWSSRAAFGPCLLAEVRDFVLMEASQTPPLWTMDASHGFVPVQVQLQWQKWLVSGHREPYNVVATVQKLADAVRSVRLSSTPLAELDSWIHGEACDLPAGLYASPMLGDPVSFGDVWRARKTVQNWDNPVGRLTLAAALHSARSVLVAMQRSELETAQSRVTLAVAAYGQPVTRLEDLVEAGLLPEVPLDPFTGQPINWPPPDQRSQGN